MTTIAPGIYPNMDFATYFELDAWGSSALRAMRQGPPARVIWQKNVPRSDTAATLLGSAVHSALLTPHLFADTYICKRERMSFATKEGKAWRDEHARFKILPFEDFQTVSNIVEAIMLKANVARTLDEDAIKENTLVARCPGSGEMMKARPDWIWTDRGGGCIYDLKITRHAGTTWAAQRAYGEGWMHQLAYYRTVALLSDLDVSRGRLVIVEPDPPHFVWTLEVKRDALDLLELENGETLKQMRDCRAANAWPGPPDEWKMIEPPPAAGLDAMNDVQFLEPEENKEGESDA